MSRGRVTVARLAKDAGLDTDETLVTLWEAGFSDVVGPQDVFGRGTANRARRALGIATRREVATLAYWQTLFGTDAEGLRQLLGQCGLVAELDGVRLPRKAIHRLRTVAKERQLLRQPEIASSPNQSTSQQYEPLEWVSVGHVATCTYLDAAIVEEIHNALVVDFYSTPDPLSPPGVKSQSLLESACGRPRTSLGSTLKYPTIEMAAAALLHSLVHSHPFHNGNKRTALVSMLAFMDENGMTLTCSEDELFKLVLQLAQHRLAEGLSHELQDRETLAVAQWIKTHSRWVVQGDRFMQWRKLKRVLTGFGCNFNHPKGLGNRILISRVLPRRWHLLFSSPAQQLSIQASFAGDGAEVNQNTIHTIRRGLHLDDEHGVDTRAFYEDTPMSPDAFILRYRKLLRRLAKM